MMISVQASAKASILCNGRKMMKTMGVLLVPFILSMAMHHVAAGEPSSLSSIADPSISLRDPGRSPLFLDTEADMAIERQRVLASHEDSRYFGGLLDHRSRWGTDSVPEALRGVETDIDQELRFDYEHSERHGAQETELEAEIEWNYGLMNFELEVPWQNETMFTPSDGDGPAGRHSNRGLETINFSIRHPLAQYVSPGEAFDYTVGFRLELGIPTRTMGNVAYHFTGSLIHTLFIGDHLSFQARTGVEYLSRTEKESEDEDVSPRSAFRFDLVIGYDFPHEMLPIPLVANTIPLFEMNYRRSLSYVGSDQNELFGTAGIRVNLEPIGIVQPKIGLGYVFPMDDSAREEARWGIITSMVFEF